MSEPLPEFRVAIVGSRGYPDLFDVHAVIDNLLADAEGCQCVHIVSGGAPGVDSEAAEYGARVGCGVTVHRPDYAAHGSAAPHVRNREIVDDAHQVIALWDGKSPGTRSTINIALSQKKNLEVVFP